MRYFPRAVRRRTVAALAAALVCAGVLTVPLSSGALADDDLKDRKHDVQEKIEDARTEFNESSEALQQATARLRKAQQRLDAARERLAEARSRVQAAEARAAALQAQLEKAERKLRRAREKLRQGRASLHRQQEQVAEVINDFYTRGAPRLRTFSSLLQAGTVTQVMRRVEVRDVILSQQEDMYGRLRAIQALLRVREKHVEAARDAVAAKKRAAERHLRKMRRLKKQAAAAERRVQQRAAARRAAREHAEQVRQHDRAVLQELKEEKERISEMLRRRAARARRRARQARQAQQESSDQSLSSSSVDSGGYLSYPVNGPVTSPYGYRIHPIYGYRELHNGIDFGVGCGTPMRAAADGVVVERYYQTAWGNRLIIDHGLVDGVGLATIYNHARSYTVSEGEHVERGEVIGYVGTTGWSTGCHLHFTVTENGNPVDPLTWL